MKTWIFKTLKGEQVTVFFKGDHYIKVNNVNRKTIAEFKSRKALEQNPSVEIANTNITVGFKKLVGIWNYPQVIENGTLLYGSPNGAGPEYAINEAFTMGLIIAILNILYGSLLLFSSVSPPILENIPGIISMVSGIAFLILSIGIKKRSLQALYIYIIALVVLLLLFISINIASGLFPIVFIAIRLVFIFAMVRAVPGMQIVQSQKEYKSSSDILDSDLIK